MPKIDLPDLGITALGVVLAFLVINAALAGALLEIGNPAASTRWWPGYPAAGAMVAEQRLSAGDVPGALKAADWVLARQPLDVSALRTAGLAIEQRAGPNQAEPLMRFAGGRSWRDAPTMAWLLKRDLFERHVGPTVDDFDAMLRQTTANSPLQSRILSVLSIAANLPPFVAPLTRHLALRPPWRYAFLMTLAGSPQDHGGALALLSALRRTDAPPTGFELAPYISRLVSTGDYVAALNSWRALSPDAAGQSTQLLRNGTFDGTPDETPLDWVLASGPGVTATIGPLPDAPSRHGLRIEYDGVSQSPMPRQLLVLQPGAYRLTGNVSTELPAPGSALRWSLICAKDRRPIAQSDGYGGSNGPSVLAVDFAVTADCPGVWLALEPNPGERAADMIVWFSNLAVRPAAVTEADTPARDKGTAAASNSAAN